LGKERQAGDGQVAGSGPANHLADRFVIIHDQDLFLHIPIPYLPAPARSYKYVTSSDRCAESSGSYRIADSRGRSKCAGWHCGGSSDDGL